MYLYFLRCAEKNTQFILYQQKLANVESVVLLYSFIKIIYNGMPFLRSMLKRDNRSNSHNGINSHIRIFLRCMEYTMLHVQNFGT